MVTLTPLSTMQKERPRETLRAVWPLGACLYQVGSRAETDLLSIIRPAPRQDWAGQTAGTVAPAGTFVEGNSVTHNCFFCQAPVDAERHLDGTVRYLCLCQKANDGRMYDRRNRWRAKVTPFVAGYSPKKRKEERRTTAQLRREARAFLMRLRKGEI